MQNSIPDPDATPPSSPSAPQPPMSLEYGMFVKAAYDVFDKHPDELNPSQNQYPDFPKGFKLVSNIQMSDFFNNSSTKKYYGFVAQSALPSDVLVTVLALRGTQTAEEWWDDAHWKPVPFTQVPHGGNVAEGFLDIYQKMVFTRPDSNEPARPLIEAVGTKDQTDFNPGAQVDSSGLLIVVAHSLGSALATLYSAHLASLGHVTPHLYTLASPRVGDGAFVQSFNSLVETSYRIYNSPDIVPDFPKDFWDNYDHVKGGYKVDSRSSPDVKKTIACYHSCFTYLFLLGAPESILGGTSWCQADSQETTAP